VSISIYFTNVALGSWARFPAFVTSFKDNLNLEWSQDSVYGRMDPIATYKNTRRSISCTFTIPSNNFAEAQAYNEGFADLMAMMYPVFAATGDGSTTAIQSSPLFKVRYANLICDASGADPVGLLGFFTEFKYDPNNDSNVFVSGSSDADFKIYYQSLNCSFTFNVLHTHRLGFNLGDGSSETKFTAKNFPYQQPVSSILLANNNKANPRFIPIPAIPSIPSIPPIAGDPKSNPMTKQSG